MTLEQKIGQLFICGWTAGDGEDATAVTKHAEELVKNMQVGGVVLMPRNVSDNLAETAATIHALQKLSEETLFVCVDQEGGMITRFQKGLTVFPSAMAHGATADAGTAFRSATANARELGVLGVNWNFAPVADVNNNLMNPIIGTRSYGENAQAVAQFVTRAVRGHNEGGVISAVKHFPGHGDTAVDSHLELPAISCDMERMESTELVPFKAAIAAGAPAIMTAHIMFTELDSELPATLSNKVISGLLREKMEFDGLVITDCLEMKAIADKYGSMAAVMAIEAGADLLLVCHTPEVQKAMYDEVLNAAKSGRITKQRLEKSLKRIRLIKSRISSTEPGDMAGLDNPEHAQLRDEICQRAVTVVKNAGAIPLRNKAAKIVVAGLHSVVPEVGAALTKYFDSVNSVQLTEEQSDSDVDAVVAGGEVVVMLTASLEPWCDKINIARQTEIVRHLRASGKSLVVVAVRDPYDICNFPEIENYICMYGYRGGMVEALAGVIAGRVNPRGQLPVTLSFESDK